MYHAIGDRPSGTDPDELFVPTSVFEAQMRFLAARRRVVPLKEIVGGRLSKHGRPAVAVTFDDAYRNVLLTAAPILRDLGLPSTMFVPTGWIGKTNSWVEPPTNDVEIMSEVELSQLQEMGVDLQSHGHAHLDYSVASSNEVADDLASSTTKLKNIKGELPKHFAYPYGRYNAKALEEVRLAGYEAGFTIDVPHSGLHAWERVWIRPGHRLPIFAFKTSGLWSTSFRSTKLASRSAALVRPILMRKRHR